MPVEIFIEKSDEHLIVGDALGRQQKHVVITVAEPYALIHADLLTHINKEGAEQIIVFLENVFQISR